VVDLDIDDPAAVIVGLKRVSLVLPEDEGKDL
jgi:hypothetical protein